jgi:hypothetical protein
MYPPSPVARAATPESHSRKSIPEANERSRFVCERPAIVSLGPPAAYGTIVVTGRVDTLVIDTVGVKTDRPYANETRLGEREASTPARDGFLGAWGGVIDPEPAVEWLGWQPARRSGREAGVGPCGNMGTRSAAPLSMAAITPRAGMMLHCSE